MQLWYQLDFSWIWNRMRPIALWFCLIPVHTCVVECAWNVGYICHWGASFFEDAPLVEFMYLAFTRMPSESYCRRLRSLLLYSCYVFWALIISLACWLYIVSLCVFEACLTCLYCDPHPLPPSASHPPPFCLSLNRYNLRDIKPAWNGMEHQKHHEKSEQLCLPAYP